METDTEKERSVVFNTSRLIDPNKGLGRALRKYRHSDALKREKILLTIKTFCPSPVLNVLNCDKRGRPVLFTKSCVMSHDLCNRSDADTRLKWLSFNKSDAVLNPLKIIATLFVLWYRWRWLFYMLMLSVCVHSRKSDFQNVDRMWSLA